jgi:hypothetical protein
VSPHPDLGRFILLTAYFFSDALALLLVAIFNIVGGIVVFVVPAISGLIPLIMDLSVSSLLKALTLI